MGEDWEKYWMEDSFLRRVVSFARSNYFADISVSHLGDIKNKKVLEPGCGTCESLVRVAKKAEKVVGMDMSHSVLSLAKKNFLKNNLSEEKYELVKGDIQNMKFQDEMFDTTFNAGVIEHFDDDKINNRPVEEMLRVTKKGGSVIILVPSAYSLYRLYYMVSRIPGLNSIYPWGEEHRFYTFKMMQTQLEDLKRNHKIKYSIRLCWRSGFIYLVANITKL